MAHLDQYDTSDHWDNNTPGVGILSQFPSFVHHDDDMTWESFLILWPLARGNSLVTGGILSKRDNYGPLIYFLLLASRSCLTSSFVDIDL